MTFNAHVTTWHCFKTELLTHIPVVSFWGVPDLRTLNLKLILGIPLTHNPEAIVRHWTFIIHMVEFPRLCEGALLSPLTLAKLHSQSWTYPLPYSSCLLHKSLPLNEQHSSSERGWRLGKLAQAIPRMNMVWYPIIQQAPVIKWPIIPPTNKTGLPYYRLLPPLATLCHQIPMQVFQSLWWVKDG